jgi:hypothetical protein
MSVDCEDPLWVPLERVVVLVPRHPSRQVVLQQLLWEPTAPLGRGGSVQALASLEYLGRSRARENLCPCLCHPVDLSDRAEPLEVKMARVGLDRVSMAPLGLMDHAGLSEALVELAELVGADSSAKVQENPQTDLGPDYILEQPPQVGPDLSMLD